MFPFQSTDISNQNISSSFVISLEKAGVPNTVGSHTGIWMLLLIEQKPKKRLRRPYLRFKLEFSNWRARVKLTLPSKIQIPRMRLKLRLFHERSGRGRPRIRDINLSTLQNRFVERTVRHRCNHGTTYHLERVSCQTFSPLRRAFLMYHFQWVSTRVPYFG